MAELKIGDTVVVDGVRRKITGASKRKCVLTVPMNNQGGVEVTPEMVESGVRLLDRAFGDALVEGEYWAGDLESLARSVYNAMRVLEGRVGAGRPSAR